MNRKQETAADDRKGEGSDDEEEAVLGFVGKIGDDYGSH